MLLECLGGYNDIVNKSLGLGVFAEHDVDLALYVGWTILESYNIDIEVLLTSV